MSVPFADEPIAEPAFAPRAGGPVETVILGRSRDLGGFAVRRALPAPGRRMVGPFIFLDQMGPADFAPGEGSTSVRIPISASPPSPICSRARSPTATASDR